MGARAGTRQGNLPAPNPETGKKTARSAKKQCQFYHLYHLYHRYRPGQRARLPWMSEQT
jgi:hypothetical protein